MKNLQKYINRIDNISRVTDTLMEQSSAFAHFVICAMTKAGISSLLDGKIIFKENYYRLNSGGEYDKLCLDTGTSFSENGNEGDLTSKSCYSNDGHYLCGDFNCWVQYPNREEIIMFNKLVPEILEELAQYGEITENNFSVFSK